MIKPSLPSLALDDNLPKFKKFMIAISDTRIQPVDYVRNLAFFLDSLLNPTTSTSISWPHLYITTYGTYTKSEGNCILSQPKPITQALILSKVD